MIPIQSVKIKNNPPKDHLYRKRADRRVREKCEQIKLWPVKDPKCR